MEREYCDLDLQKLRLRNLTRLSSVCEVCFLRLRSNKCLIYVNASSNMHSKHEDCFSKTSFFRNPIAACSRDQDRIHENVFSSSPIKHLDIIDKAESKLFKLARNSLFPRFESTDGDMGGAYKMRSIQAQRLMTLLI